MYLKVFADARQIITPSVSPVPVSPSLSLDVSGPP